jgi:hypothetical protein
MRRLIVILSFALIVGGTAVVGAQSGSQQQTTAVGAQQAGCATPLASPEASPFTTGEGLPGATPSASPVDLIVCPTPEDGTPAS